MKSVVGQFSKASKGDISDQDITRAKWVSLETNSSTWLLKLSTQCLKLTAQIIYLVELMLRRASQQAHLLMQWKRPSVLILATNGLE